VGDSERVKIVKSCGDLVGEHLGSLLRNFKVSLFQVCEEVTSAKVFHDDVDVVLVLEDIQQSNDIGMLAHLQNFNLSPLQLNILNGHLLLRHHFDSHFFTGVLVHGGLDETKLSFTKGLLDIVVVEEVRVADDLLDGVHPLSLVLLVQEIVLSWLVSWENQRERIQHGGAIKILLGFILDEYSYQVVHTLVLLLLLVFVDVQLFSQKAVPILLEFGFSGFPDHFTLKLN